MKVKRFPPDYSWPLLQTAQCLLQLGKRGGVFEFSYQCHFALFTELAATQIVAEEPRESVAGQRCVIFGIAKDVEKVAKPVARRNRPRAEFGRLLHRDRVKPQRVEPLGIAFKSPRTWIQPVGSQQAFLPGYLDDFVVRGEINPRARWPACQPPAPSVSCSTEIRKRFPCPA